MAGRCDSACAANCQLQAQGGTALELPMRKKLHKNTNPARCAQHTELPGGLWVVWVQARYKNCSRFPSPSVAPERAVDDAEASPQEAYNSAYNYNGHLR